MDSNAVVLDLLHHDIINRGDQRTITRTEDPTEQNKFLHLYLKEKCTEDAFHLVCDIISDVKGNPKMSALGIAMKRRLETGNYIYVRVCVCLCTRAHAYVCVYTYVVHLHACIGRCTYMYVCMHVCMLANMCICRCWYLPPCFVW